MSDIDTTDKKKVISVTEDGAPITGEMVAGWCSAYDEGKLPEGYELDGTVVAGKDCPSLHSEIFAVSRLEAHDAGDEETIPFKDVIGEEAFVKLLEEESVSTVPDGELFEW